MAPVSGLFRGAIEAHFVSRIVFNSSRVHYTTTGCPIEKAVVGCQYRPLSNAQNGRHSIIKRTELQRLGTKSSEWEGLSPKEKEREGQQTYKVAMDIRSIIDSEDTPPPRKPSVPTPVKKEYRPSPTRPQTIYETQAPVYDNRRERRPPQPTPLQTPAQNGFHFANGPSHNTVQSPYQHTVSTGSSSGPCPPTQSLSQSPSRGHPPPQYAQREGHSASAAPSNRSFGHSTPLSQTPTSSTPGSAEAYSNFPRPTSSHSIPTPSSAQHPPAFFRESPQPSNTRIRNLSQSQPGPQYMSQPGTPLGPPSSYRRSSFNLLRESPGTHDRQRNLSGGSYGQPQSATPSPATAPSPQNYRDQRSQSSMHGYPTPREREKSLSVSPKTRLPSLPSVERRDPLEVPLNQAPQWSGYVTPAKRKAEPESSHAVNPESPILYRTPSRVTSIGVHGLLNAEPSDQKQERASRQQQTTSPMNKDSDKELYSSLPKPTSHTLPKPPLGFSHQSARAPLISKACPTQIPVQHRPLTPPAPMQTTSDSSTKRPSDSEAAATIKLESSTTRKGSTESPSQPVQKNPARSMSANTDGQQPVKREHIEATESGTNPTSEPAKKKPRLGAAPKDTVLPSVEKTSVETSKASRVSQPGKKKPPRISRWQDVPVYAQSVRGPKRTEQLFALSKQGRGTGQSAPPSRPTPNGAGPVRHPSQANGNTNANGHVPQTNGVHIPVAQPTLANNGPLGPWEPSILNIIPSEELVRVIMDWLFEHVVMRDDVGVGPAGGAASQGAVLEIEAKIGRLEDTYTNERIKIPVLTECVVSHLDPSMKIRFKSSMTEVSSLCGPFFCIHRRTDVPSLGSASCPQ